MNDILESQFSYIPEVVGSFTPASTVVCGGMGGSALPVLVAEFLGVSPAMSVHRSYGLPTHVQAGASYIALSYSGNTEETLSFAHEVLAQGLPLSIITSGGALLQLAQDKKIPYVLVPSTFQPRDAILAMTKALLTLLGENRILSDLVPNIFNNEHAQEAGEKLRTQLTGLIPIFYSSTRNEVLSYIAKIQCNETAKILAFSNVFSEMNHNEMQGYGFGEKISALGKSFVTVFIRDESDDARIAHRMELTEQLIQEKGIQTTQVVLPSTSRMETFLFLWWCMRTTARGLAQEYGVEPDETPLIEAFKAQL